MAAFEVIALDTATPQLRAPGASDTYTFPRAVEMPLGTANGVLYLNGSKVVTSGSALTYNGTNLTVGNAGGLAIFARVLDAGLTGVVGSRSGSDMSLYNGGGTTSEFIAGANELKFNVATSEQMRLTSTGLGIGTSSPGAKLEVAGSIRSSSSIFAGYASGFDQTYIGSNGATGNGCVMATVNYANNAYQPISYDASVYLWRPNGTERMRLDSSGNLLLNGTSAGASAVGTLAIFNGTAPTGSVTDGIILYAEDVSSSSELKVRDEAGNVTTLSPHNFSLIPEGPSEDMAWAYYSEKGGKRINVDMLKLARMVEKLTGEKLVYES